LVEEQDVIPTPIASATEYQEAHYSLSEETDYETWEKKGVFLQAVHKNINWWIGDWILFGERKFPDKYSQAVFITGKSEPTLRNCAWVSSVFPPEERTYEDLTYTHYLEVAGVKDKEERHSLLRQASEQSLSALALRRFRAEEVRLPPVTPIPEEGSSNVPQPLQQAIEEFSSKMLERCPISDKAKNTEVSVNFPWGRLEMKFIRD